MAERRSNVQRTENTIARIGWDAFEVRLPKLKDLHQAKNITKKTITELDCLFSIEGHQLQIAETADVSGYPLSDERSKRLIKFTDDAIYVTKRQARNRYAVFELDA